MPTYQYACTECADRSEVVQRFDDEPLTVCTACGGKLRKIFSPVGIVFKGSGFYRTDSRNGANSVPAAKDASVNGSNGSNGSSSDSAPAGSEPAKSGSATSDSGSSTASSTASGDKKASSVSTAAAK